MPLTQNIKVSAGGGSTITIGSGLLAHCGEIIHACVEARKVVIITDSNVGPLYAPVVQESLEGAGFCVRIFTFAAGEASKNMHTLSQVLEFLAAEQLSRTDCVVALGGGVVGDLAGFAAGCYLRGIQYVQMPTTLLAAVDSSVGGKTAVDLSAGKNLAGLFWQPALVLCSTDCLDTLPPEVFLDGTAEAIKTAVLADEELFALFEKAAQDTVSNHDVYSIHENREHDSQLTRKSLQKNMLNALRGNIQDVISRCVAIKAQIVEADEREAGLRKTLNLGHTVGHAIESCSNYSVQHGHAVAIGMAMITRAAAAQGVCGLDDARRILDLLASLGLPVNTVYSTEELMQVILHDKKRTDSSLTLVLPRRIGSCVLQEYALEDLPDFLESGRGSL